MLETEADYGMYHVSNTGDVITWAELAKSVFELSGHDSARVGEVTTDEYFANAENFAPRPENSALDLSKIKDAGFTPRDHAQALKEYLQ